MDPAFPVRKDSPFPRGVFWCPSVEGGKWEACIKLPHSRNGMWEHIGYFEKDREAALAYDAVAHIYHMPVNIVSEAHCIAERFQKVAQEFHTVQEACLREKERAVAEASARASKKAKVAKELGDFLQDGPASSCKDDRNAESASSKPKKAAKPSSASSSSSSSSSPAMATASAAATAPGSKASNAAQDFVAQPLFAGETVKLLFDDIWEPATVDRETVRDLLRCHLSCSAPN